MLSVRGVAVRTVASGRTLASAAGLWPSWRYECEWSVPWWTCDQPSGSWRLLQHLCVSVWDIEAWMNIYVETVGPKWSCSVRKAAGQEKANKVSCFQGQIHTEYSCSKKNFKFLFNGNEMIIKSLLMPSWRHLPETAKQRKNTKQNQNCRCCSCIFMVSRVDDRSFCS